MAKFKKGDRVRCVRPDMFHDQCFGIGDIATVIQTFPSDAIFRIEGGALLDSDYWELATPEPIPETVTIGGVEYIRKPEQEHVWAWGQWARVDAKHKHIPNEKVFVTGPTKVNGWVPVSHPKGGAVNYTDGICPSDLTYLGTADIPQ